jgi:hypothetical protein
MSEFKYIQNVALDIDLSVKVQFMECLHWDFASAIIFLTEFLCFEGKIMLDRFAWDLSFLVLSRREAGGNAPESSKNRNGSQDSKEQPSFQSTSDFVGEVVGNDGKKGKEEGVGKMVIAGSFSRKRGILDCR